ncbi:uncharacterized protein LOC144112993 [Amblyomma americanum]
MQTDVSAGAASATTGKNSERKWCKFCDKAFSNTSNLRKHVKNVHGEGALQHVKDEEALTMKVRSFSCDLCPKHFVILRDLRRHHVDEHNFEEEVENLVFDSNTEFCTWKDGEESRTCCHFIASTGRKESASSVFKRYLHCHHSGTHKELPIEQRQRQKKGQGSCRIGKHCSATLEVTEKDSKVYVVFQKKHYGHFNEVCHQRLSQDEARVLAGRLAEGVPAKTVVHNIRADTSGSSPRMQLVTTKDLRNIADKFRIGKEEQRDPDDFKSVDLWVEEMRAENESPLLYYMKKGDPNSHDGDFELALMTFPQRELLSKLGTEKLCIDSTHGTNKYKFQLTTLLTISEDGSGIPCAYVISKRVNMGTMVRFFEAIKEKTNTVQCQAFMSDDAPVYGNAWEQVMGTLKSRLLCSWHVLHNWGARLNTVPNKDCRDTIRDMLHTLMKCTDETEFQQLLPAFLSIYSKEQQLNRLAPKELEELDGFIRYFEKTYAKRACQWAYCYRQYIGLTTNNHLESMHKTLKYSHFGGKINGRLDKLIKVLFYLTSDKLYNRAIALMKGGADHRKSVLFGRHKVGIELCKTSTERVGDGQWHVKSQSLVNFKHTVQRTSKSCSGCELHCKQCEACHNMFTCTCVDHAMHAHMCKHMHAVALIQQYIVLVMLALQEACCIFVCRAEWAAKLFYRELNFYTRLAIQILG